MRTEPRSIHEFGKVCLSIGRHGSQDGGVGGTAIPAFIISWVINLHHGLLHLPPPFLNVDQVIISLRCTLIHSLEINATPRIQAHDP